MITPFLFERFIQEGLLFERTTGTYTSPDIRSLSLATVYMVAKVTLTKRDELQTEIYDFVVLNTSTGMFEEFDVSSDMVVPRYFIYGVREVVRDDGDL